MFLILTVESNNLTSFIISSVYNYYFILESHVPKVKIIGENLKICLPTFVFRYKSFLSHFVLILYKNNTIYVGPIIITLISCPKFYYRFFPFSSLLISNLSDLIVVRVKSFSDFIVCLLLV